MRLSYDTACEILAGTAFAARLHPCDCVTLKIVDATPSFGFRPDKDASGQILVCPSDKRLTIIVAKGNPRLKHVPSATR